MVKIKMASDSSEAVIGYEKKYPLCRARHNGYFF
jgi:hypothetical protein